jgi:hypothetical protein
MKTSSKLALGAVVLGAGAGTIYLVTRKGEAAAKSGYLQPTWLYALKDSPSWMALSSGGSVPANIDLYFLLSGINTSDTAQKVHIDLKADGVSVPAYINQDKMAEPNNGSEIGFGPVKLGPGSHTLDAVLKIGGVAVDTASLQIQAA